MQTQTKIIDYFRRGLVVKDKAVDFAAINKKAVKLGWIVSPECCNTYVEEWLGTLTADYNATFYKEWSDILSKDRFELFLDQIRHYASTYGKRMNGEEVEGNGWVPNDGGIVPQWKDLKILKPITAKELADKCFDVLKSGIALKDTTMKALCDFFWEQAWEGKDIPCNQAAEMLSEVKNKEAMVYLSDKMGILPADEFGMLRCIAMKYVGKPMLIKSKATIAAIKAKAAEADFQSPLLRLTDEQIIRLSRVFLRYKPIFLAMKGSGAKRKEAGIVNKLRRLAKKNHKPFKIGFWEGIIANPQPIEKVREKAKDLDNFRKVRLMMLCKERMNFDTKNGVFTIRNGKQWVRENYHPQYDKNWVAHLYFVLEESLVDSLKSKSCTVKFPEHYDIALPTSEKNFVGNYPYGTSFGMTEHNVLGVYWKNEWGTCDYDLSYVDMHGHRFGWNSQYKNTNNSLVFSGDMTNADPYAVELFYARGDAPDGILKNTQYCGEFGRSDSKFRFFFANECLDGKTIRNHMVDPNNIKFDVMIEHDVGSEGREKTIGMILGNRFYLMDFGTGKRRAASGGKYAKVIIESMQKKAQSFIHLKEILLRAGFAMWKPPMSENEDEQVPDIDFTKLEKDTLIKLLD